MGIQTQFGHQRNIALGMAIRVTGSVSIFAVMDFARCVSKYIPDGPAFTVCFRAAFDLASGCRGAEEKSFWKLWIGHGLFKILFQTGKFDCTALIRGERKGGKGKRCIVGPMDVYAICPAGWEDAEIALGGMNDELVCL